MNYPNFEEEKKLWKKGFKYVVGLDEAGRGPLAGPVVAAAVCCNFQFSIYNLEPLRCNSAELSQSIFNNPILNKINDSKKMTPKAREEIYEAITKHNHIRWGIGIVSEKIIDKINILEATKLAMQKALKKLKPDYLLLDGNFAINSIVRQKSIIKGDQIVFSISVASIIAKVTRDRLMEKYHKKYPKYGFDKHKGYGTELHIKMLKKYGPCKIHRKTFYPVSDYYSCNPCV